MRPDRVEVSWDAPKSKWLIRIETGEEVLRRHCDVPKNSDDQTLRAAVQKTVEDERYELDPRAVGIRRPGLECDVHRKELAHSATDERQFQKLRRARAAHSPIRDSGRSRRRRLPHVTEPCLRSVAAWLPRGTRERRV